MNAELKDYKKTAAKRSEEAREAMQQPGPAMGNGEREGQRADEFQEKMEKAC